jgi:hypothetical protein
MLGVLTSVPGSAAPLQHADILVFCGHWTGPAQQVRRHNAASFNLGLAFCGLDVGAPWKECCLLPPMQCVRRH